MQINKKAKIEASSLSKKTFDEEQHRRIIARQADDFKEAVKDADLLLHDAQYTDQEYETRVGWGHSTMRDAIRFAEMCKVKQVALFHHDPSRTDKQLDSILADLKYHNEAGVEISICAEGDFFFLD